MVGLAVSETGRAAAVGFAGATDLAGSRLESDHEHFAVVLEP